MLGELWQLAPWFAAMLVVAALSTFFSGSEAALFYLSPADRRRLAAGGRAQRAAAALLADSDRLLTAILFWNLLANFAYFTIVSIAGLRLERAGQTTIAWGFSAASVFLLIVCCEVLPKNLAVLQPRLVATLVALPLSALVRLVDPLLPALKVANLLSQRLLWPRFRGEPYLAVNDLERALELSTGDAALVEQEQTVLQHIVQLSELRVDELMRPRSRIRVFRPPVRLSDFEGALPPSGYLIVSESEGDEVAAAVSLRRLADLPDDHLEKLARPVAYVPWCVTVAEALEQMRRRNQQVAAVVNEFGETIGIVTFEDVLETVFTHAPSRTERLLHRAPIRQIAPGVWLVNGMTSLRRLARKFDLPRPETHHATVAGAILESLERLPRPGDVCRFGPFEFRVVELPGRGQMLLELRLVPSEGATP